MATQAKRNSISSAQGTSGLASRRIALELLRAVLTRGTTLESAMEAHRGLASLEERDRAFAHNLVATTLRRLGQIDSAIEPLLKQRLRDTAEIAQFALRLGACQILFLGTPPHAAVTTSVSLMSHRASGFKGLLNAVLRRLAREGPAIVASQDAARLNTPDWLWQRWTATYGEKTCRRICEAHSAAAPLDISVKRAADIREWATRLDAKVLATGTLRRSIEGRVSDLPGYAEGAWWVQDAAASLPARLFERLNQTTVIDLCAAPGGKTAQLAAAGADVIAVERSPARAIRLAENLKRLRLDVKIVTSDAVSWRPETMADAVLLDAPCSATGTIRRHPDILHLKSAADLAELTVTQSRLLDAAAAMVKPGGLLVYAVCSLELEEGPQQIDHFLVRNRAFERLAAHREELDGTHELIDPKGDLRTLPCHWAEIGGLDGFYAARLRRRH